MAHLCSMLARECQSGLIPERASTLWNQRSQSLLAIVIDHAQGKANAAF
jgi:hypothetical protein